MQYLAVAVLAIFLQASLLAADQSPFATCDKPVLFAYGSWDKQTKSEGGRLIVRGVNAQGGGGWNVALDASADDSLIPVLRLRTGAGNQVGGISLLLMDDQGRTGKWNYRLPASSETLQVVAPVARGSLLAPAAREKGDLNLAAIRQWQVVGDWSDKTLDLEVEALLLQAANTADSQAQSDVLPVAAAPGRPFDLVEVLPLTERIVMVHVVEGRVIHHQRGQKRGDSRVELTPLEVNLAAASGAWRISSATDAAFSTPVKPERVGRKAKGIDFAWMIQGWDAQNNRAVNKDPDHAKGHWIYLQLPAPMQTGKTYSIDGTRIPGIGTLTLTYNPKTSRSEAVHVNVLGYVPDTSKFAYVFHWAGDLGSLDLSWLAQRDFSVLDQRTGKAVFTGKARHRAAADRAETVHLTDTPKGSFLGAEVWECDFTTFTTPGTYTVSVDGVGCSFPFSIGADVYREAFRTTARGLYHQRSGIALTKPYTEFERPAPANPKVTPGFAGKLIYTSSSMYDWKEHDSGDVPAIIAGAKGPLEVAGFYQDAGDWDSYPSHLNVATTLLFAYEMAPRNFSDKELNIPESGNGVPDIIDEAAWLPRFCQRLRQELLAKGYGTGGIGLRIAGDFTGSDVRKDDTTRGSWEDDRVYYASGEDAVSTIRYAGVAAHLAHALSLAKVADPEGIDWRREALESWTWAQAHAMTGNESFTDQRMYAAAALYRLTGDVAFEKQLYLDTAALKLGDELWYERPYGMWLQALGGGAKPSMPEQAERLRQIVLRSCEIRALETTEKRALRWGGGLSMPMLVGQQTTPWIMEGMIGATLLKQSDPAKAAAYRNAVATTCDYMLGGNSLNHTWVTGLGVRHVNQVFHMDGWYNGKATVHPGVIPYGPWREADVEGSGPWDVKWPNKTVYPHISQWPGNERWFENRNCPLSSEFTIHQTTCWAAAVYGWMCAPR